MSMPFAQKYNLLSSAITTITTASSAGATFAGPTFVGDRQKMSIQFTASAITSGSGVFTVWVSNDGTNFKQYNRLVDNLTAANTNTDTLVASSTLSSNTTKMYFFSPGDCFAYIQASVTRTTDGTYSATLFAG